MSCIAKSRSFCTYYTCLRRVRPAKPPVIPGRLHKRVHARLRCAMGPDPESKNKRKPVSGFRVRPLARTPRNGAVGQSHSFSKMTERHTFEVERAAIGPEEARTLAGLDLADVGDRNLRRLG